MQNKILIKKQFFTDWQYLLGFFVGLCFLLPNHYRPWSSFHTEFSVSFAIGTLFLCVLIYQRGVLAVDWFFVFCFSVALTPWVYFYFGKIVFAEAFLVSVFLISSSLCYLCAKDIRIHGSFLLDFLFSVFLTGGLLSVALQILQWTGRSDDSAWLTAFVFHFENSRPAANLAQPNQLATLLVFSFISLLYFRVERLLRFSLLCISVFVLALGVAVTQSRTGLLEIAFLVVIFFLARRIVGYSFFSFAFAFFVLVLIFLWFLPHLAVVLDLDVVSTLADRSVGEVRLDIWRQYLDASTLHPWIGYGWNQGREAWFSAVAPNFNLGGYPVGHAHNFLIDLIIYVGYPLAAVVVFCFAWFFLIVFSRGIASRELIVLSGVGCFLFHAFVELPHHYAYFLLPFFIFLGLISKIESVLFFVGSRCLAVFVFCILMLSVFLAIDYLNIERKILQLRFHYANFDGVDKPEVSNSLILGQLSALYEIISTNFDDPISLEAIQRLDPYVRLYPSVANLMNFAKANARNYRYSEAAFWLDRACYASGTDCFKLKNYWDELSKTTPEYAAVLWSPERKGYRID